MTKSATNVTVQRARLAADSYRKEAYRDIDEIVSMLRRHADDLESEMNLIKSRENGIERTGDLTVHDLVEQVVQAVTSTIPSNAPIVRLMRHSRRLAEAERTLITAAVLG